LSPRRRAIARLLVSALLFAIMGVLTKDVAHDIPGPQIACVRFALGTLLVLALRASRNLSLRPQRWGWLFSRGFFGGIAVVAFFAAIERVPVGLATLLNQTQPVFTLLFSWWLLAERPRRPRALFAALALTWAGVAMVLGLHVGDWQATRGLAYGVLSAVTSGIAVTSVRAARRAIPGSPAESPWSVFLSFSGVGFLVTLPFVLPPFGHWVSPSSHAWLHMILAGSASVAAQLILTEALGHVTSIQAGSMNQLTVLFTVALGSLVLGETVTVPFVVGGLLTLLGVYATLRSAL
jgi:drug/metabolite transporter (DMT)-like permease